jgi:carbon-monoxide dehydrogenase large subunit
MQGTKGATADGAGGGGEQEALPAGKFAVGQSVARSEDPRLLTGGGRFVDDIELPRQAQAQVLRSAHGHGLIRRLEVSAARAVSGVLAIYTGADLEAAGYGPLPCPLALKSHDGRPPVVPPRPALALQRVRHVGEPLALVVAETLAAARDGAERIELEIEPLAAVANVEAAAAPGAPLIWEQAPGNLCLDWRGGDAEAVARAFSTAAHVTRLRLVNNRVVVAALEPRAAIAEYDAAGDRLTLHVGSQGVVGLRQTLAEKILKIPPERLRVRTPDVGGSFGMKSPPYPEYVALLHAARELGRPVKWRDERSGSFVSDQHGRDSVVEAELALDEEGNFLAVRVTGLANMGAYLSSIGPMVQSVNILKNLPGVYRTPVAAVAMKCLFTNTTPVGPYRGAGRPEGNYFMERLVDRAARETGRDPVELRRRNLIPASAMPYRAASGQHYDSGDFPALLDGCLERADWGGFPARRAQAGARGKLRGIGLACYLEVTAPQTKEMGGLRFEADGTVSIVTGTLDYGQGHASTFAQILVDKLGLPFERIRLLQGDSDELLGGGGTGGSRSTMSSGSAILAAADRVIEQGRALAGQALEAAAADIAFERGAFRIVGTDRAITVAELADRLRAAPHPEGGLEALSAALMIDAPPSAFPNGCHVCEVEIGPEDGAVAVVAYTVLDDFGVLVNPMLVEGQVQGGIVQGIGQALMERTAYDGEAQLLSGSFMDYALPRAEDIPWLPFASHPVPATTNPLGVKGCGEAGVTGALPAVMNAVMDALAAEGIEHLDMPATPERVWAALNRRKGA